MKKKKDRLNHRLFLQTQIDNLSLQGVRLQTTSDALDEIEARLVELLKELKKCPIAPGRNLND
jgi:hypothetical protein